MCKTLILIAVILLVGGVARAGTLVQFRTIYGDLPVELFDDEKPVTVGNFVRLTRAGVYQNSFFHRCVPGFVLQGGGFAVQQPASTALVSTVIGVPNAGPITNEFAVGPLYSNVFGTIAMAKVAGNPDSATSQWFFNLADNSTNLNTQNGGFTVFGRLLGGTNLLNSFNSRSLSNGIVNAGGTFSALPVTFAGHRAPRYNELIFVDVSLLHVAVSNAGAAGWTISWLSATGFTHVVEYTDAFPPDWQELQRTNGTGGRMEVHDAPGGGSRFYRVRVE